MNERVPMIRKKLKKKLEPYRYEHTLSVSYTAMALAMRYGCDLEKAELAGLLHDCARQFDNQTIYEKCLEKGIPVTEDEEKNKVLLHAKYGSYMAEHKYQITDPEILSAIRYHTTGKPDMTLLEKIIYIADYIEPRRNKADNLDSMRQLAFVDIDQALTEIMQGILVYLNETGSNVDSQTESAIDYYQNRQAI
ncbi:MAG: bis(5'-nucleosyl)-tetraphosphatase (symmetrical) YqeK [Lachnospiraceae bacterium]